MGSSDYLLEKRLLELDKDLHGRFTDMVFALQHILSNYKLLFPAYTDHTELHSMAVIEFCNELIGVKQIERLNADEIYILLSACYLHDVGMGITQKNYDEFKVKLPEKEYFESHPNDSIANFIRTYHHEFSGMFIKKYAEFLEIPSKEHLRAIIQVSRGHRKTDLFNEDEYQIDYKMPNGNSVCLVYLASLVRLADEIHVMASRNPKLLYDIESITAELAIIENKKVLAVKSLEVTDDAFIMHVDRIDKNIINEERKVQIKMQDTLDYCRKATNGRTPYVITQERVIMEFE